MEFQLILDKFTASINANKAMPQTEKERAKATLVNVLWEMSASKEVEIEQQIKDYENKSLNLIENMFTNKADQL